MTTILSPAGAQEVFTALSRPPADTPERRATFARARAAAFLVEQVLAPAPLHKGS